MTLKLTNKDVIGFHTAVVNVPYCGLQYLTRYIGEIGYNHGVYGWNWTCYSLRGQAIVTGYRDFISTKHWNVYDADYNKCKLYNNLAAKLSNWDGKKRTFEHNRQLAEKLFLRFIRETVKGGK